MSLSQKLKELRKEKGLSQMALADMLGLTQQAIGKWERDKSTPDYETLRKIAQYFHVTTDYLLGSTAPTFNPPAEFFNDPEVGARVEQLRTNPKFRLLLCASKDLTADELDSLIALAEHYAKKHGMTE